MSSNRLDAFARGQIIAHADSVLSPSAIAAKVKKKEDKTPKVQAVRKTIAKKNKSPEWRGANAPGGPGHNPFMKPEQKQTLVDLAFEERVSA